MKLVSILIKEGRKEDLKKKYSTKFNEQDLEFILNISELKDFNHKYTDFVLRTLPKDSKTLEDDVESTIWAIKDFDKYQSQLEKKDINQYGSYLELEKALYPVRVREKEKILEKQVEKIYEDDKFLVIKPKTHEASCKYGANTKWCTTSHPDDHFKRYTSGSQALYYVINKKNSTNKNYSKVAIHYDGMGNPRYWDSQDDGMNEREVEVFKYAFPEMIEVIEKDYKKIASSAQETFLNEVFNSSGASLRTIEKYLRKDGNLTVSAEGFETINDLGPGHANGQISISHNKKLIDSYVIFITYKSEDRKTFSASIGFMGTDDFIDTEDFIDLGLEGWGFDSKYMIQGFPQTTADSVRNHIASKVLDYVKANAELQQKVVGSAKVFTSTYGYTFSKNKGWVKKLVDYLDSGKIGTKLDFLTDIGYIVKINNYGKIMFRRHNGQHLYTPRDLRGQHASFFAAAKNAGILGYRKVGREFFLTKGPNFDAFKSGELKAL
jgi:hypothetical protein